MKTTFEKQIEKSNQQSNEYDKVFNDFLGELITPSKERKKLDEEIERDDCFFDDETYG